VFLNTSKINWEVKTGTSGSEVSTKNRVEERARRITRCRGNLKKKIEKNPTTPTESHG